jgi:hypothetical protein
MRNTRVEVFVRYLVDPKHAGGVKTDLIRNFLDKLNTAPERVKFPKSDAR